MVENALSLFKPVFSKCAEWTGVLLGAVGGKGVVLAAFVIVLVIGLLFIPMRGIGMNVSFDDFTDFTRQVTYKGKYASGKRKAFGGVSGKFSRPDKMRSRGGHKK